MQGELFLINMSIKILHSCIYAGSGSAYLYGFFDQAWKEGMTQDEAEVCAFIGTVFPLPHTLKEK